MTKALLLRETRVFLDGVTIPEGGLEIPEETIAVMTVDGVVTHIQPGTYDGKVCIEVLKKAPVIGKVKLPPFHGGTEPVPVALNNPYRAALMVNTNESGETYIDTERSASSAIQGGEASNRELLGGFIKTQDDCFNGVFVIDGQYAIKDTKFDFTGAGGDDFEMYGAAIAAAGYAELIVENVDIKTHGNIAVAIEAAEEAKILVKDSTISTVGDERRADPRPSFSATPWVLGLTGTVRATNAVGAADVTYYNSKTTSDGWGIYAVDDSHDVRHNIINSDGIIDPNGVYKSGYGAYVLGLDTKDTTIFMTTSNFLGTHFEGVTYGLVFAGSGQKAVIGPSSKANLMDCLGSDSLLAKHTNAYSDVVERESVFHCTKNIAMFHGATATTEDASLEIRPGSELHSDGPSFVVKCCGRTAEDGTKSLGVSPVIKIDGAKIYNNGVLLHYMESDDAGMGYGDDAYEGLWAPYYEVPNIDPKPFEYDRSNENEPGTMQTTFCKMVLSGNIYNTVWKTPQNLCVTMSQVQYTGAVATGVQYHHNFKPGDKIYPKDAHELGNVGVTPKGDHVTGIILKLENGSTWTVTETSYLSKLEISEDSAVVATEGKSLVLTLDGVRKELAAGIYVGDIALTVE